MIAMDPQQRLPLSLKADLSRPEADRPVFYARVLTAREFAKVSRLFDETGKTADAEAVIVGLVEILKTTLVGWDRVRTRDGEPAPFNPDAAPDLLTINELWELVGLSVWGSLPTEDDKKKSESPSDGSGATSAPAAPAAQANPGAV